MMRKQNLVKLICLFMLILNLGGCWDKKEIEKNAFVVAIGIDKGTDNRVTITYLIANPNYGTQQQGGGDAVPREIITFEADDFISAKNRGNTVIAKEISYDLLKYLIVSEKLAKDKNFIKWIYTTTKDREIRRDSFIIVVKEKASQFITKNDPKLETAAHKYFDQMLKQGNSIGLVPFSELHTFLRITEADADLFLAAYATTEHEAMDEDNSNNGVNLIAGELFTKGETNRTQFLGSAVFKEGVMIGKLTGEETRIFYLINNLRKAPTMITTISDPLHENESKAIRIKKPKKNDVKLKIDKQGDGKIIVKIPLTVDVLSDFSMENYAKSIKKREILKKHIEEQLTKRFENFIKRTQEEFKGQPFGWSLDARRKVLTIPEYKKFNWMETYPDMEVSIAVDIKFGEFGRQSKLPHLKEIRE